MQKHSVERHECDWSGVLLRKVTAYHTQRASQTHSVDPCGEGIEPCVGLMAVFQFSPVRHFGESFCYLILEKRGHTRVGEVIVLHYRIWLIATLIYA
jgi:hypothetical protein